MASASVHVHDTDEMAPDVLLSGTLYLHFTSHSGSGASLYLSPGTQEKLRVLLNELAVAEPNEEEVAS